MEDSNSSSSDEDDVLVSVLVGGYALFAEVAEEEQQEDSTGKSKADMRGKNNYDRLKKRNFDHAGSLHSINRDYLGPTALFGAKFCPQFRISRARFQRLLEDVMNSTDHKFFKPTSYISNATLVCLEARLLLPLKTYAYGVPPKCFCDYFQMSFTLASVCCKEFDKMIVALYKNEYLKLPTIDDVQSVTKLHKAKQQWIFYYVDISL